MPGASRRVRRFLTGCTAGLPGSPGSGARRAFWDSILDRYADGSMAIRLIIYLMRLPFPAPLGALLVLSAFALIGSNLISYSSARAESLGIDLGKPTLASKGTRTSVLILCVWGSLLWPQAPILALICLAVHPNTVVVRRLMRTIDQSRSLWLCRARNGRGPHG